jgi:nicotinamidase-related amidase
MYSGPDTVHVAVDMQRLFDERTDWYTPALAGIVPNVAGLARAFAGRNYFTRFVTPARADEANGRWQVYYRTWSGVTTEVMDPAMMDVVAPLAPLVEVGRVVDKTTYSCLQNQGFLNRLSADGVCTLVFSGVETDVCVLASVLDAVDAGFHAVVVTDAVASSVPASHEAVIDHVFRRLPDQVTLLRTAELIR